jgi:hypothetical protein
MIKKNTLLLFIFMTSLILGQDKLTSSLGEYFDGTNWVKSERTEYTYDSNKNLTEETGLYWNGFQWIKSYVTTYTYNANNKATTEIYQNYDSNNTIIEQYKTTNTYDSNGKLTEFFSEFNGGESWEFEDKFILEYTNSRLSGAISYAWNESDWVLEEESSKITISYNANNKVSLSKSDSWDGTKWVDSDRTVYTFNGNNSPTLVDGQTWDGVNWSTDYKTEYTYDANGNAMTIKEFYKSDGVLMEEELQTMTYDSTQLMSDFSHPFRDKTGLDALFSVGGIINKILSRSTVDYRLKFYYGNEPTASVNEFDTTSFSVYPNPTTSIVNIDDSNFSLRKVEVFNIIGKKIMTTTNNKINMDGLVNGVYLLKVQAQDGNFATKRIIKK